MTVELNIFNINKQPLDYDEVRNVFLIEEITNEAASELSLEDLRWTVLLTMEMIWTLTGYLSKMMLCMSLALKTLR
jgi:hypothetical protein